MHIIKIGFKNKTLLIFQMPSAEEVYFLEPLSLFYQPAVKMRKVAFKKYLIEVLLDTQQHTFTNSINANNLK